MITRAEIKEIALEALKEDLGDGDLTSEICLGEDDPVVSGRILAREDFVIAGIGVARILFSHLDPDSKIATAYRDGKPIGEGDVLLEVKGRAKALLGAERTVLNFISRLSGIATETRECLRILEGYDTEILDTRKTTPLLRSLEKYAVLKGGGKNHRRGLFDGVLIKENHIKTAGGLRKVLRRAKDNAPYGKKIEVEVENLEDLKIALEEKADIVLLDNMSPDEIKQAVQLASGNIILEASGGITKKNIEKIARTGVDYISMGSLTHSVSSVDISFLLD